MKLKKFPYETKLPASPVYYLCQRHPELKATPTGDHALGKSVLEGLDEDDLLKELKGIYRDATWKPATHLRLTLFFMMFFLALPEDLQAVLFEEIFTFLPFGTNIMNDFMPEYMQGGAESKRGENIDEIVLFAGMCVVILVLYCVGVMVAHWMNS